MTDNMTEVREDTHLVEVWGDTVDQRHVLGAVAIGVVLAVPSFLIAHELFAGAMDNQDLAKTYAMLTGLGFCVIGAVISARLFPPKRDVTERQIDPQERLAAVMELAEQPLGIGRVADLDAAERAELDRLGLTDVFLEAERRLDAGEGSASQGSAHEGDAR